MDLSTLALSITITSCAAWVCAARARRTFAKCEARFQFGMITETEGISWPAPARKSLFCEKKQVVEPIAPRVQIDLAQPRGILNRDLGEPDARVSQSFNLDLFRDCHTIGFEDHFLENGFAKHPHSRLRIAHPPEV